MIGPSRSALLALVCSIVLPAAYGQEQAISEGDVGAGPSVDCGVVALYTLMALEGKPVTLESIFAALPERPQGEYSVAELADAARALGVRLDAMRWPSPNVRFDRPIVAFLQGRSHGHFQAVSPLGRSGRLIHVFEHGNDPEIRDLRHWALTSEWQGVALRPRRAWDQAWWWAILGSIVVGGAFFVLRRRRAGRIAALLDAETRPEQVASP